MAMVWTPDCSIGRLLFGVETTEKRPRNLVRGVLVAACSPHLSLLLTIVIPCSCYYLQYREVLEQMGIGVKSRGGESWCDCGIGQVCGALAMFEVGFRVPDGGCGKGFSANCSCQSFATVIEPGMAFNVGSCWFCWCICYLKGFMGFLHVFLCWLRFLLWQARVSMAGRCFCGSVVDCSSGGIEKLGGGDDHFFGSVAVREAEVHKTVKTKNPFMPPFQKIYNNRNKQIPENALLHNLQAKDTIQT